MEERKTIIKQKVATKISTANKVVLAIMIASTFSVGLSFGIVAFNVAKEMPKKQLAPKTIHPTPPPALVVTDLIDANTNNPISTSNIYGADISFYVNHWEKLGNLNLNHSYYESSDPMDLYPDLEGPLFVHLFHQDLGVKEFPATVITISYGDEMNPHYKDLCLPATKLHDGETYDPVLYYFAEDGTPYRDQARTQMAIPQNCPRLLSKAASYENINDANPGNYIGENGSLTFVSGPLGNIGYTPLQYPEYQALPLDLTYAMSSFFAFEVMATSSVQELGSTVVSIDGTKNGISGIWHLCLPKTKFAQGIDNITRYFYDENGTPYGDPLYLDQLIPYSCDKILGNKLLVEEIESVWGSATSSYAHVTDPMVHYFNGSSQYYLGRHYLDLDDYEEYDGYMPDLPQHKGLLMLFGHNGTTSASFPADYLHLDYLEPDSTSFKSTDICWPTTIADSHMQPDPGPSYYFYDNNGKPYNDALLLQPVSCKSMPDRDYPIPREI